MAQAPSPTNWWQHNGEADVSHPVVPSELRARITPPAPDADVPQAPAPDAEGQDAATPQAPTPGATTQTAVQPEADAAAKPQPDVLHRPRGRHRAPDSDAEVPQRRNPPTRSEPIPQLSQPEPEPTLPSGIPLNHTNTITQQQHSALAQPESTTTRRPESADFIAETSDSPPMSAQGEPGSMEALDSLNDLGGGYEAADQAAASSQQATHFIPTPREADAGPKKIDAGPGKTDVPPEETDAGPVETPAAVGPGKVPSDFGKADAGSNDSREGGAAGLVTDAQPPATAEMTLPPRSHPEGTSQTAAGSPPSDETGGPDATSLDAWPAPAGSPSPPSPQPPPASGPQPPESGGYGRSTVSELPNAVIPASELAQLGREDSPTPPPAAHDIAPWLPGVGINLIAQLPRTQAQDVAMTRHNVIPQQRRESAVWSAVPRQDNAELDLQLNELVPSGASQLHANQADGLPAEADSQVLGGAAVGTALLAEPETGHGDGSQPNTQVPQQESDDSPTSPWHTATPRRVPQLTDNQRVRLAARFGFAIPPASVPEAAPSPDATTVSDTAAVSEAHLAQQSAPGDEAANADTDADTTTIAAYGHDRLEAWARFMRTPRGRWLLRLAPVALVLVLALVVVAVLQSHRPVADAREQAIAAWRSGNSAWADGNIDQVCDRHDGLGQQGMWPDRATCMASEMDGYQRATKESREQMKTATVPPDAARVLPNGAVMLTLSGVQPFKDGDFVIMQQESQGGAWKQVGARFANNAVGYIPPDALPEENTGPASQAPPANAPQQQTQTLV